MKTSLTKSLWLFACYSLIVGAASPKATAQTPASLSVQVSAGHATLSIAADVGSAWTIEYVNSLDGANAWLVLTNVTLSSNPLSVPDTSGPAAANRFYRAVFQPQVTIVATNLIWLPPGSFVMGSPTYEVGRMPDETQHTVTLTHGFYMSKYLVTQNQYLNLTGNNPSYFNGVRGATNYGTDLSRPVENVYWFAASGYCSQFTQQEQQAGHIPTNWVYRLPTESEWEYACRAGTTTEFGYGQDPSYTNLANYAWYSANSGGLTQDVGLLRPNPWGLYDMEGDVFEWCQDWYGAYPSGPVTDPQGPASGSLRVFRGGSWAYGPTDCRCASRYSSDPETPYQFIGFRVVLAPSQ